MPLSPVRGRRREGRRKGGEEEEEEEDWMRPEIACGWRGGAREGGREG